MSWVYLLSRPLVGQEKANAFSKPELLSLVKRKYRGAKKASIPRSKADIVRYRSRNAKSSTTRDDSTLNQSRLVSSPPQTLIERPARSFHLPIESSQIHPEIPTQNKPRTQVSGAASQRVERRLRSARRKEEGKRRTSFPK